MIITVDCGSTNMRCRLFDSNVLIDEIKEQCGIRNTAFDGNNSRLESALRDCIAMLLSRNHIDPSDVEMVVSSGTLASNVGIYHVPHALAPIGVAESAAAAKKVVLPHISPIPILFIPGVRTEPSHDETDEMRKIELYESMGAEECENYGIAAQLGLTGNYTMILPGSYCQTFDVDYSGRITSIMTCMCGEFISAIAEHTLMKHTLPSPVIREIIPERLLQGYDYCASHGVSCAMFKTRMINVWGGYSIDEAANYLVGTILHDSITAIAKRCNGNKPIIIGGSEPLRSIFRLLLEHEKVKNLIAIDDKIAHLAPSIGAMAVYDVWKQKNITHI